MNDLTSEGTLAPSDRAEPAADVVCMGEILWDALPTGLYLGGAPFNVACHLHNLGVRTEVISRVGRDRLGEEALRRVRKKGLATDLIQLDDHLPTGFVSVDLEDEKGPAYEIHAPAAWDAIEATEACRQRAAGARAVVFGSLAQRNSISRRSIRSICEGARRRVFDVNLRPPHDEVQVVRESLVMAEVVKLNEEELGRMAAWFGLPSGLQPATLALADRFHCDTVCVTRGGEGAILLREGRWLEHPGYPVEVVDTVGAGDAFLAALLHGLLTGVPDEMLLGRACRLGAYVASRPGAIPPYDAEALEELRRGFPGTNWAERHER